MERQLNAELAIAMLAYFIADCSVRIAEQSNRAPPNKAMVAGLTQARDESRRLRCTLDSDNVSAVQKILDNYGPLVRQGQPLS